MKAYTPGSAFDWTGRIDSETDFDAFRWHQWVETMDIGEDDLEPLEKGIGFALIGFCSDEGVSRNKGRQGASNGPDSIRRELRNKPCPFTQAVKLVDMGNIHCVDGRLEEAQNRLSDLVSSVVAKGWFPLVLGGGHEVAFGNYNGVAKGIQSLEPGKTLVDLGIINFDAHFDLRPVPGQSTSGTMFRQIADQCADQDQPFSYFCIGIQENANTVALFKTAKELGVEYILAKEMANRDDWSIAEKLDLFIRNHDHLYVTICADVIASAFAPGVSAAQPLGIMPEQLLKWLKHILLSGKTLSFDIAEVSPRFDHDHTTANLAAVVVFAVVRTLAQANGYGVSY